MRPETNAKRRAIRASGMEADHVVPLNASSHARYSGEWGVCGLDVPGNLVALTPAENSRKWHRWSRADWEASGYSASILQIARPIAQ